ncbi:endonuclease/exonuclease/phosphatase family protein [Litorihabitans aurantiacus]|uniref:Endonuclease/exonuclease/phosphatase domain-containing protein n=1 Tax=Litorihabitans aurantiacus TaxID=1930061 RepID=A0AA38CSS6_9MICO|nr:endonuclease/exonuclease/phosphatase family protein [Litorihabitans aurantiacus]GMA31749.1 hypothetical protein GCM10025875_17410 [Litorihabitans aurantiacus]
MPTTIRVLSWNVLGLREPARAAGVVRRSRADVVCLQECPRWPGSGAVLAAFARAVGMRVAAGGGACGVAVLVGPALSVDAGEVERMPRGFSGAWWTYPRATATAHLRVAGSEGSTLRVSSLHLDVDEQARLAHVDRVLAGLDAAGAPPVHVVAGDLNARPGDATWDRLGTRLRDAVATVPGADAPTYPSTADRRPRTRLDAVLVAGAVRVLAARTGSDRPGLPSDHLPVLVDLEIGGGSRVATTWERRWGAPGGTSDAAAGPTG